MKHTTPSVFYFSELQTSIKKVTWVGKLDTFKNGGGVYLSEYLFKQLVRN